MRTMLMLLVVAFFAGCSSDDPQLNSASNPPNSVTTSGDDIPSEVMSSWGRQRDFFRKGNFAILDWEEAKAVLRQGNLRGGKQYHTGWLTIYTHDERQYLTKQPKMDAFFTFMKKEGLSTKGFATE